MSTFTFGPPQRFMAIAIHGPCGGQYHGGFERMADDVNSPEHYTSGGIETIDFIEAKLTPEEFIGYCKGTVLAYVSRAKYKGEEIKDLQKAAWYLDRLNGYTAEQRQQAPSKRDERKAALKAK